MSLRMLKWLTVAIPTALIGGFEYLRHHVFLDKLSMETGNVYITIMVFILSYAFATWMFRKIRLINTKLTREESHRAVYEDRERLSRELHDNIAQMLFFLNVSLTKNDLEDAKSAVTEIDHHLRQAIFNLRSSLEDGTALDKRVEKWMKEWSAVTGIEVHVDIQPEIPKLSDKESTHLFAVIQEAFINIRKHSLAAHAALTMQQTGRCLEMIIADDGRGIMEGKPGNRNYGLLLMRKRAEELGADLSLRSEPGGGTKIRLTYTR